MSALGFVYVKRVVFMITMATVIYAGSTRPAYAQSVNISNILSMFHSSRQERPVLSMAVISDVHVRAPLAGDPRPIANDKLRLALACIREQRPDVLVVNGDVTTGALQDYQTFNHIITTAFTGRTYTTIGNHEYYGIYKTDDRSVSRSSDERAKKRFCQAFHLKEVYYDRWEGPCHLIFLGSEAYSSLPGVGQRAWLSHAQLAFLSRQLMESNNEPTIVFSHQPVRDTVGQSTEADSVIQSEQIRKILQKHPGTVWFSGHTHRTLSLTGAIRIVGGTLFAGGGTTYYADDEDDRPFPGSRRKGNKYVRRDLRMNTGWNVQVYRNHVEIQAWDYMRNETVDGRHVVWYLPSSDIAPIGQPTGFGGAVE